MLKCREKEYKRVNHQSKDINCNVLTNIRIITTISIQSKVKSQNAHVSKVEV